MVMHESPQYRYKRSSSRASASANMQMMREMNAVNNQVNNQDMRDLKRASDRDNMNALNNSKASMTQVGKEGTRTGKEADGISENIFSQNVPTPSRASVSKNMTGRRSQVAPLLGHHIK